MRAGRLDYNQRRLDDVLGFGHRNELVYVQIFIAQLSVKRFSGFARGGSLISLPTICPIFERPGLEFGAMIDRNGVGPPAVEHTI